jgi:hypothetical protein
MQLAAGCGLVCPWFEGKDSSCCGRAGTLWQVYNLGLKAAEEVGWQPKQWIAPECREIKTKRVPKVKSPLARTSRDNNIIL